MVFEKINKAVSVETNAFTFGRKVFQKETLPRPALSLQVAGGIHPLS